MTFPTSGGPTRSGIWQIAFDALGLGQRLAWSLMRTGFDELKYAWTYETVIFVSSAGGPPDQSALPLDQWERMILPAACGT